MSDLAALFPDLPADVIRDFNAPTSHDGGLTAHGDRGQVTDDEVEAYLHQIGSLRAPLSPVISNQTPPDAPQFHANGRIAPPADSATVEPPDYGDGTTPPPSPDYPQEYPQEPVLPSSPPATPSSPPPAPEPEPSPPEPEPSSPVPPSPGEPTNEGNQALAGLLESDPNLRQLIAQYYQQRFQQQPQPQQPFPPQPQYQPPPQQQYLPPPAQYTPPPQPQYAPQSPLPQFDEFTDPNIRALYEQNARLEQRLNTQFAAIEESNRQAQEANAQRALQVNMEHFTRVVEGAVSQWGDRYQIPPEILRDIRQVAARMGSAQTYMNGLHPITGAPVIPDPSEATKVALDIAYNSTPSARELERQRTIARARQDVGRRQKLAGIGGSSGSVPRQQPAPTDAAGRRSGMISEVREMLNGEWSTPN